MILTLPGGVVICSTKFWQLPGEIGPFSMIFTIFEDFYDLVALENFFQRDDS